MAPMKIIKQETNGKDLDPIEIEVVKELKAEARKNYEIDSRIISQYYSMNKERMTSKRYPLMNIVYMSVLL